VDDYGNSLWCELQARQKRLLAEAANDRLVKQAFGRKAPLAFRLMTWLADSFIHIGMSLKRRAQHGTAQSAYMSAGFTI